MRASTGRMAALVAVTGVMTGSLAGCALFRPAPQARAVAPITLSGPMPQTAVHLVEPQITVIAAPRPVDELAGGRAYAMWCADCHGVRGLGDGRVSGQTAEPPANLTELARANGGTLPVGPVLNRLQQAPGPFHRGIAADLMAALDGPLVDWAGPDGRPHMVTARTADLLGYLQALQL
ncbi:hypothetical protein [Sagittula salina]|uniref:Cytochrome c domain-containing protein n=1 Tax=Sagittula salina TaxID=2820268 RepID=A0A940S1T3_9RHOB|nr:hypothetical protein [Sagittula salina]MBP0483392.1 hypothetical protein [Sagittula salina]